MNQQEATEFVVRELGKHRSPGDRGPLYHRPGADSGWHCWPLAN